MPTCWTQRNIRCWNVTRERLDAIYAAEGISPYGRLIEALVRGWAMLSDGKQAEAIRQFERERSDAGPQGVTKATHAKIRELCDQTRIPAVALLDAMAQGWDMLTFKQKREAIRLSADPTASAPGPGTPGRGPGRDSDCEPNADAVETTAAEAA